MEDDAKTNEQQPGERAHEGEEATRDLPVGAREADKVKGGVVGPCDRSKQ